MAPCPPSTFGSLDVFLFCSYQRYFDTKARKQPEAIKSDGRVSHPHTRTHTHQHPRPHPNTLQHITTHCITPHYNYNNNNNNNKIIIITHLDRKQWRA